jgi:hypothetical protein
MKTIQLLQATALAVGNDHRLASVLLCLAGQDMQVGVTNVIQADLGQISFARGIQPGEVDDAR